MGALCGRAAGLITVTVAMAIASGCSAASTADRAAPAGTDRAAVSSADTAGLDAYFPSDAAFYDELRLDGALLARPPVDVPDAAKASTAVVRARIGDVAAQRVIGDLQTVGVQLTDVVVLRGQLRPELGGKVTVELPVGGAGEVARLTASLPQGPGIWFLRWQGEKVTYKPGTNPGENPADPSLYHLLHMNAMFVQGKTGVVNPLGEHAEDGRALPGLQADAEKLTSLSALAERVRSV